MNTPPPRETSQPRINAPTLRQKNTSAYDELASATIGKIANRVYTDLMNIRKSKESEDGREELYGKRSQVRLLL